MTSWTYEIKTEENGKTVGQILREAGFSRKEISRQKFLNNGITLDGEKCRITRKVSEGEKLCLNFESADIDVRKEDGGISEKERAVRMTVYLSKEEERLPKLLYADEYLAIVYKPSGMPCHQGRKHYSDDCGTWLQKQLKAEPVRMIGRLETEQILMIGQLKAEPVRMIGRLDKDTSGLLVFARDRISAARLWRQKEKGGFTKTYYARVHGKPEEDFGVISAPIEAVPGEKNKMRAGNGGAYARTDYRVVRNKGTFSDVECMLHTGRTHQIRVHMQSIGHPILGDRIYGIPDQAERLMLHAAEIRLCQPFSGGKIEVKVMVDWMKDE